MLGDVNLSIRSSNILGQIEFVVTGGLVSEELGYAGIFSLAKGREIENMILTSQ